MVVAAPDSTDEARLLSEQARAKLDAGRAAIEDTIAGFKGLTDALGGVEVNIKQGFTPSVLKGKVTFQAGKNMLDGEKALAFVRERKSFPDSDYTRVKNQQLFLKAVISKTISR